MPRLGHQINMERETSMDAVDEKEVFARIYRGQSEIKKHPSNSHTRVGRWQQQSQLSLADSQKRKMQDWGEGGQVTGRGAKAKGMADACVAPAEVKSDELRVRAGHSEGATPWSMRQWPSMAEHQHFDQWGPRPDEQRLAGSRLGRMATVESGRFGEEVLRITRACWTLHLGTDPSRKGRPLGPMRPPRAI
ncbi:hypothetical protein N7532_004714 [Penicillium argentinense]|uniref:Uncharacterized protein n=1 Tax=Penicillium argentinense TaxID=1131581 RepID=A0A9W9FPX5_9EURO|nr:uncharacterized protein N7532_004714 [Penicillium argentinense]KAJ5104185.1 hypothetical protein N7532_004714 [Penicillium argentinense]